MSERTASNDPPGSNAGSNAGSDDDPHRVEHPQPQAVGTLALDGVQLPVFDLADFNAADLARVSSFVTNFGVWQLPADVAGLLGSIDGRGRLEWIHDTGELVLLGGVPTEGMVTAPVSPGVGYTEGNVPSLLGGSVGGVTREPSGEVRELFRSEVLPAGSRVALLAHVRHGPRTHELLWGWHRAHRDANGWGWLVERLAGLENGADADTHLA